MSSKRKTDSPAGEPLIQPLRPLTPTGRSACPYLGLPDDTATWSAFPSPTNHCHYVAKPGPIDTVHQQGFCLSDNYTYCAVLQIEDPQRLPAGVAAPTEKRGSWGKRLLVAIVLLLALIAAVLLALPQSREMLLAGLAPAGPVEPPADDPAGAPGDSSSAAVAPIVAATPTPENTPTPVPSPPATLTPAPTATRTAMPTASRPAATEAPEAAILESSATATAELPQVIVNVDMLNVRSGPGIEFPIVAAVERGRQFSIVGRDASSSWLQICCLDDQAQGWVFSESVITSGDVSLAPTVVPSPAP